MDLNGLTQFLIIHSNNSFRILLYADYKLVLKLVTETTNF